MKSKNESSEVKKIKLVKIKQWYMPFDGDSYKVLRAVGIPLVRFHEDFLPTVRLVCHKHKIRGSLINFKGDILEPFLDRIGTAFNNKEHCRASIGARAMSFETLKPEVFEKIKNETIPKLENLLRAFFSRWGYKSRFDYSEHRGKIKLVVDYWFDSEAQPIIPLEEPLADVKPVRLRIGSIRLTLKLGTKYMETIIEVAQGGIFKPMHTSRCLYSQMSSVKPMISALMEIPNYDIHNFDNGLE